MKKIKLDDISKKTPFEVPEGYFDQLMVDIQDKVTQQEKRRWVSLPQVRLALAGSFVAILVLVMVFFPQNSTAPSAEQLLAEVSDEELMEYLDLNDISEYDLVDGIDADEIDALWESDGLENLELDETDLDDLLIDYEIDNLL